MERIKELQKQRNDLSRLQDEVCEQIKQEIERYAAERYGVKPGSIVEDVSHGPDWAGKLFQAVRVDAHPCYGGERPNLICIPQKKDGSFGGRETRVYYWELVE